MYISQLYNLLLFKSETITIKVIILVFLQCLLPYDNWNISYAWCTVEVSDTLSTFDTYY